MKTSEIEKRFAALEREIADLKTGGQARVNHPVATIQRIHGTFKNDDEAALEAMRLGREWRASQDVDSRVK